MKPKNTNNPPPFKQKKSPAFKAQPNKEQQPSFKSTITHKTEVNVDSSQLQQSDISHGSGILTYLGLLASSITSCFLTVLGLMNTMNKYVHIAELCAVVSLMVVGYFCGVASPYFLMGLTVSTVFLIVFGRPFQLEKKLEGIGIRREISLPVVALTIAVIGQAVSLETMVATVSLKFEIILLILSFAFTSYGLARSGFFDYAAYHFVRLSRGKTLALMVNMYVLASLLTYVTSNDIVIIILTPILFSICLQARLKSAKILLLSQFIAANTVSMGLLIGSPTNIILADILQIGFFPYALLMAVPSLIAFSSSLLIVYLFSLFFRHRDSSWGLEATYEPLAYDDKSHFTSSMRNWTLLFAGVIVLVSIVTQLPEFSLYWVAIPTFILAGTFIAFEHISFSKELSSQESSSQDRSSNGSHRSPLNELKTAVAGLPFGIIFFGLVFFIFSAQLVSSDVVRNLFSSIQEVTVSSVFYNQLVSIFSSGFLVNTMNDLPAAAFVSETLKAASAEQALDPQGRNTMIQAVLVGLNIGCYVTPIGALAGIMWFALLRNLKARHSLPSSVYSTSAQRLVLPKALELVFYGLIHFVITACLCAFILHALSGIPIYRQDPTDFQLDSFMIIGAFLAVVLLISTIGILFSAVSRSAS